MNRLRVKSASRIEKSWGFSRAVRSGDLVFCANTSGMNYETRIYADDAASQTHQVFANVEAALAKAGASLSDTVRAIVSYTDPSDIEAIMAVFAAKFVGIEPAFTLLQQTFDSDKIKVEIEVTAHVRGAGGSDDVVAI